MGKALPKRAEDYSSWYNELVKKADLAENSAVRGCMVIKPYGYSIWEKMHAPLALLHRQVNSSSINRMSSQQVGPAWSSQEGGDE